MRPAWARVTGSTLARSVSVLFLTHERYLEHDPGRGHPERPARLQAVLDGIRDADLGQALDFVAPRPATR